MTYYYAYGSNLNIDQMRQRCPGARPVGRCFMPGWALQFRGFATIVSAANQRVPGGIYSLTSDDVTALDRYEGWPRQYRKDTFTIDIGGQPTQCYTYLMNNGLARPPSDDYFDTILKGYEDWKLPTSVLYTARRLALKSAAARSEHTREVAGVRSRHTEWHDEPYQPDMFWQPKGGK